MSAASPATAAPRSGLRPALVPAARAALLLVLGLAITFSSEHSALLGLVSFGAFAVLAGLVEGAGALRWRAGALSVVRAALSLVAGVLALAFPNGGDGYLVLVVSGWAILTGAIEIVEGLRARRSPRGALVPRDRILAGALAVLLGAALLVIPPDLVDDWSVADRDGVVQATGAVTASIVSVGLIGAWAVVSAVQLGIAAASAWRPIRSEAPAAGAAE